MRRSQIVKTAYIDFIPEQDRFRSGVHKYSQTCDHPWDPKFVAVVDRWALFRGRFKLQKLKMGLQNGGRCRQVVIMLTQV